MKSIGIAILFIFLAVSNVSAITEQQLQDADDTLRQMDSKISVLRGYVQTVFQGKSGIVTLVPSQKQILKDKYNQEKSELLDLYNQLP